MGGQLCSSVCDRVQDIQLKVSGNSGKEARRPPALMVLVPRALMDSLVLEYGVVASTEVQKQNTDRVQTRKGHSF